jgi:hypothetical protein
MQRFNNSFRTISTEYLVSLCLYELYNIDKASKAMADVIAITKQSNIIQHALLDYLKAAEWSRRLPDFITN